MTSSADEFDAPRAAPAFLTARWVNLCMLSYPVDDQLLAPHLPDGLELDRLRGQAYVSVVAFQFVDTRVRGIAWPGHRNFPEWNLRFYARQHAPDGTIRSGVKFIHEFVPRICVSLIAKAAYNEPYSTSRMRDCVCEDGGELSAMYSLQRNGEMHTISLTADAEATIPAVETDAHFFKERNWGFGQDRRGRVRAYEVQHPRWGIHAVRSCKAEFRWGALYGAEWEAMQGVQPTSVLLAAGSPVRVMPAQA